MYTCVICWFFSYANEISAVPHLTEFKKSVCWYVTVRQILVNFRSFPYTRRSWEPLPYIYTYTYTLFSAHSDRNTAKKRKNFGQKSETESKHPLHVQYTFSISLTIFFR